MKITSVVCVPFVIKVCKRELPVERKNLPVFLQTKYLGYWPKKGENNSKEDQDCFGSCCRTLHIKPEDQNATLR